MEKMVRHFFLVRQPMGIWGRKRRGGDRRWAKPGQKQGKEALCPLVWGAKRLFQAVVVLLLKIGKAGNRLWLHLLTGFSILAFSSRFYCKQNFLSIPFQSFLPVVYFQWFILFLLFYFLFILFSHFWRYLNLKTSDSELWFLNTTPPKSGRPRPASFGCQRGFIWKLWLVKSWVKPGSNTTDFTPVFHPFCFPLSVPCLLHSQSVAIDAPRRVVALRR